MRQKARRTISISQEAAAAIEQAVEKRLYASFSHGVECLIYDRFLDVKEPSIIKPASPPRTPKEKSTEPSTTPGKSGKPKVIQFTVQEIQDMKADGMSYQEIIDKHQEIHGTTFSKSAITRHLERAGAK